MLAIAPGLGYVTVNAVSNDLVPLHSKVVSCNCISFVYSIIVIFDCVVIIESKQESFLVKKF